MGPGPLPSRAPGVHAGQLGASEILRARGSHQCWLSTVGEITRLAGCAHPEPGAPARTPACTSGRSTGPLSLLGAPALWSWPGQCTFFSCSIL